jgi:predicted Rossmann fold nucleotide-binding protein DprA/Smf involved in DNA uptake
VTEEVSFAPNQLIKQGTKLGTGAEDVIEELPILVRAVLAPAEESNRSSAICSLPTD